MVMVFVLVFMLVMPVAMLTGLLVMVMMVFVYHGIASFLDAKVRCPTCNRVAFTIPGRLFPVFRVDDDRHGTIVDEGHLHVGAEGLPKAADRAAQNCS